MKFAKLHIVPALLLIAAVWLEIVASEYDAVYEGLLGRVVTPDFINQLTGSKGQTSNSNCGSESGPTDESEITYTDYPETTDEDKEFTYSTDDGTSSGSSTPTRRTQDYDYDSSPVSSIGRNVEHNRTNAISMGRNQQTNRVRRRNPSRRRKQQRRRSPSRRRTQQRRRSPSRRRTQQRRRNPSRRRTQQRRRRQKRRGRPSAQKRRRPNRNNSKDRRRRRRGGQRKQRRRVIMRRRQANKRSNGERVERPQLQV